MNTKVNKDGAIENYKLIINTSSYVYALLTEGAKKKGYSSLREAFLSNFTKEMDLGEEVRDKITYDEGDKVSIIIEVRDFIPKDNSKIGVWK